MPAVLAAPGAAVRIGIHEIPRRQGKRVEVARTGARRGDGHVARARIAERQAGDPIERRGNVAVPQRHHLGQRRLRLAEQHGVGAGLEIAVRMIRRIRPADDDATAALARRADHLDRRITEARGAHLRDVVEAVLDDRDDRRPRSGERGAELVHPLGEHGVEQRDVVPLVA